MKNKRSIYIAILLLVVVAVLSIIYFNSGRNNLVRENQYSISTTTPFGLSANIKITPCDYEYNTCFGSGSVFVVSVGNRDLWSLVSTDSMIGFGIVLKKENTEKAYTIDIKFPKSLSQEEYSMAYSYFDKQVFSIPLGN